MAAPTPNHLLRVGPLMVLPLKSFPAARNATTELVNLHKRCAEQGLDAKLSMLKRCTSCLEEVPNDQIIKAFPKPTGGNLFFTPGEVKALQAESNKAMDVVGFFPWADVNVLLLGAANFLGPVDGPMLRPFMYFLARMRERGLAAMVTYFGHGRDKVGIIHAGAETLILHDCGHSPHRDQPAHTLAAMAAFVQSITSTSPAGGSA